MRAWHILSSISRKNVRLQLTLESAETQLWVTKAVRQRIPSGSGSGSGSCSKCVVVVVVVGDIFSCHAIDNPDVASEMSMLARYGPNVPQDTLRRLVLAFGELRTMADQGLITYPYSTREVVSMVKHLEVSCTHLSQ